MPKMRFLLLFPLLAAWSVDGVHVVRDFLTPEECDELMHGPVSILLEQKEFNSTRPTYQFNLKHDIHQRLSETMDAISSSNPTCGLSEEEATTCDSLEAPVSLVRETTLPHQDHVGGTGKMVDGTSPVVFVFLQDHDEAYFVHGRDRVDVESGKLVAFRGDVSHHTVIPGQQEHDPVPLLGPLIKTETGRFSLVGKNGRGKGKGRGSRDRGKSSRRRRGKTGKSKVRRRRGKSAKSRRGKSAKRGKSGKGGKTGKSAKRGKSGKGGKTGKSAKRGKSGKGGKTGKSAKRGKSGKGGKTGKSAKRGKSGKGKGGRRNRRSNQVKP